MMSLRALSRGLLLSLAATLSLPALADLLPLPPPIVPMPIRDPCGGFSDSWSQHCRRDVNGNMIDTRTGNVFDRNGNPAGRRIPTVPDATTGAGLSAPQASLSCPGGGSNLDSLQRHGAALLQAGQQLAAAKCYQSALQVAPEEPALYVNLGLIDYEQGFPGNAAQRWREALQRLNAFSPDLPVVRSVRGEAMFALAAAEFSHGDKRRAQDLGRQALQLEPHLADDGHLRENLWGNRLVTDARSLRWALGR